MSQKSMTYHHRYQQEVDRSYTLPSYFYTDPQIFEEEKNTVFYKNWFYVGHIEKVAEPGDYFTFQLFDQNLFVMRGNDGIIRAFYNVCPHRGHELLKGEGKKSIISCPYHAWTFHTDGQFNNGRAVNQLKDFSRDEACLRQVRVEQFANFLFLNLDPHAPSMQEMMPGLEEDIRQRIPELNKLTLAHRTTYKIEGNWKNVWDNYLECHHCAIAHPQLVELIDMSSYKVQNFDYYCMQTGCGRHALRFHFYCHYCYGEYCGRKCSSA